MKDYDRGLLEGWAEAIDAMADRQRFERWRAGPGGFRSEGPPEIYVVYLTSLLKEIREGAV